MVVTINKTYFLKKEYLSLCKMWHIFGGRVLITNCELPAGGFNNILGDLMTTMGTMSPYT